MKKWTEYDGYNDPKRVKPPFTIFGKNAKGEAVPITAYRAMTGRVPIDQIFIDEDSVIPIPKYTNDENEKAQKRERIQTRRARTREEKKAKPYSYEDYEQDYGYYDGATWIPGKKRTKEPLGNTWRPKPLQQKRGPKIPKLVKTKKRKKPVHVDKLNTSRALPAEEDEV